MLKTEGKNWIKGFRIKLIILYLLKALLFSLSAGLLGMLFASYLSLGPWLVFAVVVVLAFGFWLGHKSTWRISEEGASKYLDARFPEVEESATLLLKPETELSFLEQFQVQKISEILPVAHSLKEPLKKLWIAVLLLLASMILVFVLDKYVLVKTTRTNNSFNRTEVAVIKENIPAEISSVKVKISPPVYTKKSARSQSLLTIKAETGALIHWELETNQKVKQLKLILNDKEVFSFKPADGTKQQWGFQRVIDKSGFYQIELDGKKSDLYQIEVIPDLPVHIKIVKPKNHTTIDVGQIPKVNLAVALTDDYGISEAYISATMSSGKGEGVSFTEKKLTFSPNFVGSKSAMLTKVLDLIALGMKPGDELYFFIQAMDNHGQSSRSDVYLISIVDTAELMSMAGMTNGVDLVPEYFRSQRQIIIDTEKLLKEQGTLREEEFKNRSNTLGIDQKLLRLRYGKFLGEESETEIGGQEHAEGDGHDHGEAKFGDVQALMDEYAHKHDIAEDATFFEPELKSQLKAVLNEMWSSELRLRTYKPQEALPFEYKALRLLKDLQQKSRAYVAKTTMKTVKLKAEKRLSGELDKITSPTQQATFEHKDQSIESLKLTLAILEQRKMGKAFNYGDREFLRTAEAKLINAAAGQPVSYLSALKSLRNVSGAKTVVLKDIEMVQKAIQKLLGTIAKQPQLQEAAPTLRLSRSYFNHLKHAGK